jgi:solute carrier family 25 S-adenosylmethionine transporter 26
MLKASRWNRYNTPLQNSIFGSVAGGLAAAATTPLDIIKTRQMLEMNTRTSVRDIAEKIHRGKGMTNFFSGIVPRTMKWSFGGCIFFVVYEETKKKITEYV